MKNDFVVKSTNYGYFSRERLDKLNDEMQYLKSKYGVTNHVILSSISKRALYSKTYREGNISKVADLIAGILNCYGFSTDEIGEFISKNKHILNSNYADFRYRLALLCKAGLFENALFCNSFVLTNDFTAMNYGTKDLYSVVKYRLKNNLPITLDSLCNVSSTELKNAQEECPFNLNDFKLYDQKMMLYLSKKKLENSKKKVL